MQDGLENLVLGAAEPVLLHHSQDGLMPVGLLDVLANPTRLRVGQLPVDRMPRADERPRQFVDGKR